MRNSKPVFLNEVIVPILYVLIFTFIFSGLSVAQIKSGTIVGTVTDPSGAVVPGADVTVTNQGTNVSTTTVSDKSGTFTVPYLQPGIYTVTVEKPGSGLTKYSATNISIATDQTVKIAASMTMGSSMQTVNVSAAAVELQTSSAAVQGITNEITIQEIPNLTHNAFNYAA